MEPGFWQWQVRFACYRVFSGYPRYHLQRARPGSGTDHQHGVFDEILSENLRGVSNTGRFIRMYQSDDRVQLQCR